MKTAEEIFNEHRIQWDDSKSELENAAMAKSLMLKSMREYASQAIDRFSNGIEDEMMAQNGSRLNITEIEVIKNKIKSELK